MGIIDLLTMKLLILFVALLLLSYAYMQSISPSLVIVPDMAEKVHGKDTA